MLDVGDDVDPVALVPEVVVALLELFEAETGVASRLQPSAAFVTPSP